MGARLHSLLRRQIRKFFGGKAPSQDSPLGRFVDAVDRAYREFDQDRAMLERSLDISSDELVQANAELRAVFDASPDLHMWMTREGRILNVRCGRSEDLAMRAEELIGKSVVGYHDRGVAEAFATGLARLKERSSVATFEYSLPLGGRQQTYEARLLPLPNDQVLAIIRNVTDRKDAEEQRFRQLAEHIQEVLWIRDPKQGSILFVSPSFETVWGLPREELYRNADVYTGAVHPDDRERVKTAFRSESGRGFDVEYRVLRPDGSLRWIRDRSFPVRDEAGTVYRITGIAADITDDKREREAIAAANDQLEERVRQRTADLQRAKEDLEQSQEQLRQAQKMEAVGRLAGGVAHDFNNLLVVILSYADLAINLLEADHPLVEDVAEIKRAGERAAALTQQLLAFSRRQMLRPEPHDLNAIVSNVTRLLERLIGEDVRLRLDLAPELPPTLVDKGQCEQIIMNLAVNARDAMPRGGTITLTTSVTTFEESPVGADIEPGRYATLTVRDTGTGMDDETRGLVFEPFFTTKGANKGTGLGLATVFGIVKQSRGHVEVQSELGVGSAFTVYLPLAEREIVEQTSSLEEVASPAGSERILLVEDEDMVRRLSERVLSMRGFDVISTTNAEEALAFLENNDDAINLLLTDVVLPGMTGSELCERARALRPRMRVLFMSGYTEDDVLRYGVQTGKSELLIKPFTPNVLLTQVRQTLDRRSSLPPG
ncbi:MAG TPA: PAS domain-containing sensor histidine kinase [Polyangiaceae bacterium]|nr:PAS domain-containing sensor histidine kinase [Polyangiaceae bacterium]